MEPRQSVSAKEFAPFRDLDPNLRRRLLAASDPVALRTGKALYYQGDRCSATYLVLAGRLRSVMYLSDETTLDLGTPGPGDWVGLPELVLGGPCLTDVVALEPCHVLGFGATAFGRLGEVPETRHWLSAELARGHYALHARIELAGPGQRLARWLARESATKPVLTLTQDELAAAVGTTRETVNRHLSRLQAEGIVRVSRGHLEILAPEARRRRAPAGRCTPYALSFWAKPKNWSPWKQGWGICGFPRQADGGWPGTGYPVLGSSFSLGPRPEKRTEGEAEARSTPPPNRLYIR